MKGADNYSLYAVQVLGMNEIDAARLATYGAYVRPVACVIAGLVADRYNSARSICALFIVLAISYSVLTLVTPETIALNIIYALSLIHI